MRFSCVISTHNRKTVYGAIKSILQQTHPVELIVVDDNSNEPVKVLDKSVTIIRNNSTKGLSICRNMGYNFARGDVVAYMDDDAFADHKWIEELEKCFKMGADIAGGFLKPAWEVKKPWWLKESMYGLIAINISSKLILGCNFAIRKNLLEEMNYFFEEKLGRKEGNLIAGDETTLFFKAEKRGYKILFNEKAIVYHIVSKDRLEFKYFIKRYFWEGRTESRRGTFKRFFIGRLLHLSYYPYKILKSSSKLDMTEDFLISILFTIPYFYGMFYELIKGRTDYEGD